PVHLALVTGEAHLLIGDQRVACHDAIAIGDRGHGFAFYSTLARGLARPGQGQSSSTRPRPWRMSSIWCCIALRRSPCTARLVSTSLSFLISTFRSPM